MAGHDREIQRALQQGNQAGEQEQENTPDGRMNLMRQRRATAMRKGEGKGGPQVDIPEGGGAPLEGKTKQTMESKLGADLSAVRVHTGGDSAGAADKLNAQAFTVGNDVHFGAGKHNPNSKEGAKLLAHELTHVVQGQKGGVQKAEESEGSEADGEEKAEGKDGEKLDVSSPEEPAEQEADAVADKATEDMGEGGVEAAGDEKAAGGEAAGGEAEGAAAETEEKAPEAATKLTIGAAPAMNASVLRKILRKKAFLDEAEEKAPEPAAEAAPAEAAGAEAEAAPEAAPAGEAEEKVSAKRIAAKLHRKVYRDEAEEKAAAPTAEEAAPAAEGEEKKPEEASAEAAAPTEAPAPAEAPAEEKVAAKRVAAKLHRKVYREEAEAAPAPEAASAEAAPEAASAEAEAAPEAAAAPPSEEKVAAKRIAAKLHRKVYREEAEAAPAPEAASAEAAPEAASAEAEAAPEAAAAPEAEEKVSAKKLAAKLHRKIYRDPPPNAAPAAPGAAAPANPAQVEEQRKQEISAVAGGPIEQAKDEPPARYNPGTGEVEGDKSDSDPIKIKDQLMGLTKAYIKLADNDATKGAKLEEIKKLFTRLREAMKTARGEDNALTAKRVEFEKLLGAKATNEWPQGKSCVDTMVGTAKQMISAQEQALTSNAQQMDAALQAAGVKDFPKGLEAIGKKIGVDPNIGFAGAVGHSFGEIMKALEGPNLVQRCVNLIGFTDNYLIPGILAQTGPVFEMAKANLARVQPDIQLGALAEKAKGKKAKEQKAILLTSQKFQDEMAGYKAEGVQRGQERQPENMTGGAALDGMDTKIPEQPIDICNEQQLDWLAGQQPKEFREEYRKCEGEAAKKQFFISKGIRTTKGAAVDASSLVPGASGITVDDVEDPMEAKAIEDTVKNNEMYIEGKLENIVDPKHSWIINANEACAPLKAGVSGTTARFVGAANLLGGDKNGAAVAMLGHLQAIEAHSFWEIADAAGLGLSAGQYVTYAPNDAGMRSAAAEFINGKHPDLGQNDKALRTEELLGEKK